MTYEKAIRKIKEFGLHHAIEDLPYSSYTVQAFEMAIEALQKQIPKKPIERKMKRKNCYRPREETYYTCPVCGKRVEVEDNEGWDTEIYPYCACGQKIDWASVGYFGEQKWDEEYELVEDGDKE